MNDTLLRLARALVTAALGLAPAISAAHLAAAGAAPAKPPAESPGATLPAEAAPGLSSLPGTGHVHDAALLLSAAERGRLDAELATLERRTGHVVHLLILPEMEGGLAGLDATVRNAAAKWGLGRNKRRAAILLVHVRDLDLLHAATDLGLTVPAIESGIGDVLGRIYRLSSAGDPDLGWRGAVEHVAALLEGKPIPDPPRPRPEAEASTADESAADIAEPEARPTRYVIDHAGLLQPSTVEELNRLLQRNEQVTSNKIVVMTLDTAGDEPIDEVSRRIVSSLAAYQEHDGVLLLVSSNDRRVHIEVGHGLAGALPGALCARIIRQAIAPRFQDGDYQAGIRDGVRSIIAATRGESRVTIVDRARHALSLIPPRPRVPLVAQTIIGIFYWVFSVAWCFTGPVLFSVGRKPVRLGVVPGALITAAAVYFLPGMLIALGLGVLLWLDNQHGIFQRMSGKGRHRRRTGPSGGSSSRRPSADAGTPPQP